MAATSNPSWLRVFLPFAVAYFLSYLLRNANAVIAPELTDELALTAADLGLLTSAYFLSFGIFQLPLGILLDRYGPRRVESSLLLFAAAGTLVFAMGHSIAELSLGRALVGIGVSACLMAALKNFWQWYPAERQASLNGAVMVAGGLGAVTASAPLELLLPVLGWRGVFFGLTAIIAAAAAYLFFAVPDHQDGLSRTTVAEQWRGVVKILSSRGFWRFAPQAAFFSGGFMSIFGLWAVPWFMNVDGLTRTEAAHNLLLISVATLGSYFLLAISGTWLARRGVRTTWLISGLLGLAMVVQIFIVTGIGPPALLWIGYGACASATQLAYAALTLRFPLTLAGRANTSLNLLAFAGAFTIQWGFGGMVDVLMAYGWRAASAYRAAFGLLTAFQFLAWFWFVLEGRRESSVRTHEIRPPVVPSQ
jgi:nitrate/nitrite transporter NarK